MEEMLKMEELLKLIDEKKYKEVRSSFDEINPVDLADFFNDDLKEGDKRILVLFRLMPKDFASEVFAYLDSDIQLHVAQELKDKEFQGILEELFLDDTVDFIEEMPASIVHRVIKMVDSETRKQINRMLMYPDDSAGSLMSVEFMEAKLNWTVAETIARVRARCEDVEFISDLFVTDSQRHLIGTLDFKDILAAKDEQLVSDIASSNVVSVNTVTDQSEVAEMFKRYDLVTMPVVDREDRLVGIISIDDVVDVIDEETTEDIYHMAAMEPIEESYSDTGVFTLAKKRIVWLAVLMISSTFTGMIIESFEAALAANVLLVSYIPMLMGTSGNASSQASTSVIRALVLGEVEFRDIFRVMWKEVRVSVIVGIGVGILNFLKIMIMDGDPMTAFVVSATLIVAIMVAKIVGCALPMIAQKIKLDPALMASPMITTIVDAVSLIVYFNIASLVFGLTL